MHKEIAIAKIGAYLGRNPVIAATALPNRTVDMADAAALARTNDNEYRTYIAFLRGAAYDEGRINAFVSEMQKAKAFAGFNTKLAVNGCGNLERDVLTTLTDLADTNHQVNHGGGDIAHAFRQPHLV